MCGIWGGRPDLLNPAAAQLLRHRGPDQAGADTVRASDGRELLIGQTRLAVVDRSLVPTPMAKDGSTIAYNGEVYNWRELRQELESRGRTFVTATDTEVVLEAFREWGPAALDRLNGMFAVAIWHDDTLFLARDRLGKKPLFWMQQGADLAFASEMKAFRRLDFEEVPICRALEFYFDEHTPFRGVHSLRPGEYMTWHPATGARREVRWWTFPSREPDIVEPEAATRMFLEVFEDACRIRKLADVPVTLFLSGGIDSSLIQAVLKLPVTYTVQFAEFEQTIDERSSVVEFAERLGFEPRILVPDRRQFLETLPELARAIEYPVGSLSVFPLFSLSRAARADGFVVALSGEGADELFNGYRRHELLLSEDERISPELRGSYGPLSRRYFGSALERFCRMATRQGMPGVPALMELFAPRWNDSLSYARNLSAVEATVFLQPLLAMADRLSMASSLEVRTPFLDYRLIELSARLADDLKFREGQGKWLLRRALRELVGGDLEITRRKVKHGLPAPVNVWLFGSGAFDRKDWNQVLMGESLRQLALAQTSAPPLS